MYVSLQTIIEALNYITTGDMPPNSKGAAFVFDPKVIELNAVPVFEPFLQYSSKNKSHLTLSGKEEVRLDPDIMYFASETTKLWYRS